MRNGADPLAQGSRHFENTHTQSHIVTKMLRSDDERERERGGEAPMEIDSPPPLWLKPPTSKLQIHFCIVILYSFRPCIFR